VGGFFIYWRLGMNEDDKKQEWISAKIKKLVEEGKSQEQAVAEAESMWKDVCKKKIDSVQHIDFAKWDMSTPMEVTDEGFLVGRAIVTNIGVFTYLNPDGTTRRELRLPEDVFAQESLDSYIGKPMTNNHPAQSVDTDNVKDLDVGTIMSPILHDEYHVSTGYVIKDKATIADVKMGKVALSCGYSLDLDWQSGVWMGMQYDCIQRNIRVNHIAVVDRARAGDAARIRVDSNTNYSVQIIEEDFMAEKVLRTINLDNVEYQAEDAVIEAYKKSKEHADSLQVKVDSLTAEKSAIEAEKDTFKEKTESLTKEISDLKAKAVDSAEIDTRVKARLTLLATAAKAKVEKVDGLDEKGIKVAVIMATSPKANLDGRDDVYIQARYDLAVEALDAEVAESDAADKAARELNGDAAGGANADASKVEESRKKMLGQYGKHG
jgi:uncharacterized protein